MLTQLRTPAYYHGETVGDGLGRIYAVYPDQGLEPLSAPTSCVVDGFTWGNTTTENLNATAATLIHHMAARFETITVTDTVVRHLAENLIAGLPDDGGTWQVSSLDVYLYLT